MTTVKIDENVTQEVNFPMILRGIFLIALGVSLFWVNLDSTVSLLLLAFPAILAGISGLTFIKKNNINAIPKNWLIIESIADIILGLTFFYMYLSGKNSIDNLRNVFACFAILFAFMQFTYMFQVVQTGFGINIKVLLIRGLAAIGFGLFGAILFMQPDNTGAFLINCIGLGPILSGVGCIFLSMYAFRKQLKQN